MSTQQFAKYLADKPDVFFCVHSNCLIIAVECHETEFLNEIERNKKSFVIEETPAEDLENGLREFTLSATHAQNTELIKEFTKIEERTRSVYTSKDTGFFD